MKNLAQEIELAAEGEQIRAIQFGKDPDAYCDLARDEIKRYDIGRVWHWEEARPLLDRQLAQGFSNFSELPFFAWSDNYVVFMSTYDGAKMVCRIPRHQLSSTLVTPYFPGGGS